MQQEVNELKGLRDKIAKETWHDKPAQRAFLAGIDACIARLELLACLNAKANETAK